MFTRETAEQLHETLPSMNFQTSATDDELTRAYLAHYGLDKVRSSNRIKHYLGSFESLHYRLACQYFALPREQQKGIVVLVHGYYDHIGLFCHPIEYCLVRGFSVLTFDLPGHGLSGGDPASIDSFDQYSQALIDCIDQARQHLDEKSWHILAQSTGAAAVINCLLNEAEFPLLGFDKIILLAPLLRPAGWTKGLLTYWLLRWFVTSIKRDFATNSHDNDFLKFIAEDDPLQARYVKVDWVRSLKRYMKDFEKAASLEKQLHIVQGTADGTVDWRFNLLKLKEKFPNSKAHIIEDARHHLVNESAEYREKIFVTIDDILGASLSGGK